MTEHRHEWEWTKKPFGGENAQAFLTGFFCKQKDCSAALIIKQAEAMLNAAECLTAEDAKSLTACISRGFVYEADKGRVESLRDYAERRK